MIPRDLAPAISYLSTNCLCCINLNRLCHVSNCGERVFDELTSGHSLLDIGNVEIGVSMRMEKVIVCTTSIAKLVDVVSMISTESTSILEAMVGIAVAPSLREGND